MAVEIALELQPCCGKRSGIGNYTYELARRLQDGDGLTFRGNLFNFLHRNDNRTALAEIKMPIEEQTSMPYGVYRRMWSVLPFDYRQMFTPADLTIFFNYIVPPGVTGKVITVVHDMTYFRYPETMDRRNLLRLRQGLRRSVECSDRIIAVSEFSRDELSALMGIPKERISVVPCAPSLVEGCAPFDTLTDKFHLRRPFLLYVGTIEPRKNLARLIRAFERLKTEHSIPHQLVLAGGKGWSTEEIYQSAEASPYRKEILFPGFISDKEKNALYRQADVFVFPSLYEGFGIPPLEAMVWGCPVVCSRAASLPEIVGEAAELVRPLDEADIANGIWKVLSDREYAAQLVKKGHDQVKKFTWEASADRLKQICREVLA